MAGDANSSITASDVVQALFSDPCARGHLQDLNRKWHDFLGECQRHNINSPETKSLSELETIVQSEGHVGLSQAFTIFKGAGPSAYESVLQSSKASSTGTQR